MWNTPNSAKLLEEWSRISGFMLDINAWKLTGGGEDIKIIEQLLTLNLSCSIKK